MQHGLEVMQYRCTHCGYSWVHSNVRIIPPSHPSTPGGLDSTRDKTKINFLTLYTWSGTVEHSGCIRCVPTRLPSNWPEVAIERSTAIRLLAEATARLDEAPRPKPKVNKYKDIDLDDLLS